jgi:hypothetical protein
VIPQNCADDCSDLCGTEADCWDAHDPVACRRGVQKCRYDCERRCPPPPPPPVCTPCPAPTCNPDCTQVPRTQRCTNADGSTFTRFC